MKVEIYKRGEKVKFAQDIDGLLVARGDDSLVTLSVIDSPRGLGTEVFPDTSGIRLAPFKGCKLVVEINSDGSLAVKAVEGKG